ncbi:MAG: AbrB/MazE/SpoVT family DNA-binding domain-containing protein [Actinomycetota bacterium]
MKQCKVLKLSKKSQVTIPLGVRKKLKVKPGDYIVMVPKDDDILLMSPKKYIEYTKGLMKGVFGNKQDIDAYIGGERSSWD